MLSAKLWIPSVGAVIAIAAASGAASAQTGPNLIVGHASQPVQTPLLAPAGITMYAPVDGTPSGLSVYTKGFMFCSNVSTSTITPVTLLVEHEDQSFSPAHPWSFLPAVDVATFGYNGGQLVVTPGVTLTCLDTAVDGAVGSGLSEGIFDNGVESPTIENYSHLINWIPPVGFSWVAPDWSQAPVDPCNPTGSQPPEVVEDVACAAVTGVRDPAANGVDERAGTAWTANDGINFTSLFRVDARVGPQQPGEVASMHVPPASSNGVDDAGTLNVELIESYDSVYLGGNGQYCFLSILPNALSSQVCGTSGTPTNGSPWFYGLAVQPPPVGVGYSSFYVVIIRPIIGAHASATAPAMAIAALTDPAVVGEGGDRFSGDNVLFGFLPAAGAGFPWMAGGQ